SVTYYSMFPGEGLLSGGVRSKLRPDLITNGSVFEAFFRGNSSVCVSPDDNVRMIKPEIRCHHPPQELPVLSFPPFLLEVLPHSEAAIEHDQAVSIDNDLPHFGSQIISLDR